MSDFKAKMYQIQFRLGLRPRPAEGAYSAPPDPLAGLRGLFLRGRDRRDGKGDGGDEKGEGRGRGRGGDETPPLHAPSNPYFWIRPWR